MTSNWLLENAKIVNYLSRSWFVWCLLVDRHRIGSTVQRSFAALRPTAVYNAEIYYVYVNQVIQCSSCLISHSHTKTLRPMPRVSITSKSLQGLVFHTTQATSYRSYKNKSTITSEWIWRSNPPNVFGFSKQKVSFRMYPRSILMLSTSVYRKDRAELHNSYALSIIHYIRASLIPLHFVNTPFDRNDARLLSFEIFTRKSTTTRTYG
jgi:hypothetical protein